MDEKLVVVGQYDNAEMAHLDRIALEDAGIQAVLENENLTGAGFYYPLAACDVKLLVRQCDLEQARHVLKEVQSTNPAIEDVEWAESEEDDKPDDPFYRGPGPS
jgi:hypothetical protein